MKRDLHMWKETYTYDNRTTMKSQPAPLQLHRHMCRSLVICIGLHSKRPKHMKRDLHIWKETYTYDQRPTHMTRDLHIWPETYTYEKRPTHTTIERLWKANSPLHNFTPIRSTSSHTRTHTRTHTHTPSMKKPTRPSTTSWNETYLCESLSMDMCLFS